MIFIFSIVIGLQCSVNFRLYSKVTQSHIYVYAFFFSHYLPSCSIISDQIQFPVLYSRISLLIHSKGNGLHLLIPDSQSTHSLPLPLGNHKSLLQVYEFFSVERFIYAVCQIPDICDIIWYLSFSFRLISLSTRVSSSIHVTANGIILFFLWLSRIPLCIYTRSS